MHTTGEFYPITYEISAPLPFTSVSITAVYGGWDMTINYIGKYYLNPFAWGEGL